MPATEPEGRGEPTAQREVCGMELGEGTPTQFQNRSYGELCGQQRLRRTRAISILERLWVRRASRIADRHAGEERHATHQHGRLELQWHYALDPRASCTWLLRTL